MTALFRAHSRWSFRRFGRLIYTMRAGRWLFALLTLLLASCATVPLEQFRTYADAMEAIHQTNLTLLNDYKAAMADEPAPEATSKVPAAFDPQAVEGQENPSIAARKAAVKALRDYNAKMLFLAEGGSFEAVQGRVGSLVALLGTAFPAANVVGGWLSPLAAKLEKARSAQEFRSTLQEVTVPGKNCPGKPVATDGSLAASPLVATGSVTPPTATSDRELPGPADAAACQPIMDGLFAIMKVDTASFYAAQLGLYGRRLRDLRDEFGSQVKPIYDYAGKFERPTSGPALERLVGLEKEINDIGRGLNPAYGSFPLVGDSGAPLDATALDTLAVRIDTVKLLTARHAQLEQAIIAYHGQLEQYVGLIVKAQEHLKLVEEAATKPVDNLQRAEQIIRIGFDIENGSINTRDALSSASRILLGTN